MPTTVFAPALFSLDNQLIEIECDVTSGLPGFVLVGLGDKAVNEARERVRSAIKNSGLALPPKRLTLNLAPANLPKDGTGYDLGIAVAVLTASGQIREGLDDSLFLGELALDGTVRPVPRALLAAQLAADHGLRRIYVPKANTAEAALIAGVDVIGVTSLLELYHHLIGMAPLAIEPSGSLQPLVANAEVDFAAVYGQSQAKRALEIAAAGGHNLLLSGPPGAGKTLLARAFMGLLPAPNYAEMLTTTKLHSLAGQRGSTIMRTRPFRSPHHTASSVAMVGGGSRPQPGEISLSHGGVLFLDELPEFARSVLEALRQPLEDRTVSIARSAGTVTYPADFVLIATANPCPCGYFGDTRQACTCSMAAVGRYRQRLSGPLLDRIDLVLDIMRVDHHELGVHDNVESTAVVAKRVLAARDIQALRPSLNARLTNAQLTQYLNLDKAGHHLMRQAVDGLNLSARMYTRTLKVARTIADLAGQTAVDSACVSEALQYRSRT